MASAYKRVPPGWHTARPCLDRNRLGDKGDEGWSDPLRSTWRSSKWGTRAGPCRWTGLYKWSLADLLLCFYSQGSWVETQFTLSKTKDKQCFHRQRKSRSWDFCCLKLPKKCGKSPYDKISNRELIVLNFLWSWSSLILSSVASMCIFKLFVTYCTLCYTY